ncbi:MAG: hypothetical protein EOO78_01425 [Oxalobacteraceae bacterium]|nr:MAG: hypothetical protein EOO78_01425 [Oxalobacteraceae bacterium]
MDRLARLPETPEKLCFARTNYVRSSCRALMVYAYAGPGWSMGGGAALVLVRCTNAARLAPDWQAERFNAAQLALAVFQETSPTHLIHIKRGQLIHRSLLRAVHRMYAIPCGVVMQSNHYCGRSLRYVNKPFI